MSRFCGVLLLTIWGLGSLRAVEYFPVEDLKPGMRGVTYTVLQGVTIEPVETEVLGVAKNFLGPGSDLIIAKLVDPKTALTGAVHGMSGSPLYIEGKMVGALSRRIASFEKDGHCGFTPIRDMLEVNRRVKVAAITETPRGQLLTMRPFVGLSKGGPVETVVEYLGLPLSVSGLREGWLNRLMQKFGWDQKGFVATAGSGKSSVRQGPDALQPGAPVAAVLVTGDISMAGTGTLTWREGNRVLGFGHPMMGVGETQFAMATAEIITTIPSYARPYKLSNTGEVVGTISQDRLPAIGGLVGPKPAMATYHIERSHEGKTRRQLEGTFSPLPEMAPMLLAMITLGGWLDNDDASREFSAQIEGEIRFKNHPPLQVGGQYGGEDFDLMMALYNLMDPIFSIYGQKWEKLQAESFTLKLATTEKSKVWAIESIRTTASQYEPGDKVEVVIELRERFGERKYQVMPLTLPENLKRGLIFVRVGGGGDLDQADRYRNQSAVKTVDQLITRLNQRRAESRLYGQLITASSGQIVQDRELSALPESVRGVMQSGNSTEDTVVLPEAIWVEQSVEGPGLVQGQQMLSIRIKN